MVKIYRHKNPKDPSNRDKMWYSYKPDGSDSAIKDTTILEYIKGLVIPPAWNAVTVFYEKSPKILHQGIDDKDRLQQVYSQLHKLKARKSKLCNLIEFGRQLPTIHAIIAKTLENERWTKSKVICLILRIITYCYFRLGHAKYEGLYQSYGISNILKEHVKFSKNGMCIAFIGKKGIHNECHLVDPLTIKETTKILAQNTGDVHAFRYQEAGAWHHIKPTDINDWLKSFNKNFTSKMFRTFDSNILIINNLRNVGDPTELTKPKRKKAIVDALKIVSTQVHNTPAICKKDYVDPQLIELYIEQPRKFRAKLITPGNEARLAFINYLKDKCGEPAVIQSIVGGQAFEDEL